MAQPDLTAIGSMILESVPKEPNYFYELFGNGDILKIFHSAYATVDIGNGPETVEIPMKSVIYPSAMYAGHYLSTKAQKELEELKGMGFSYPTINISKLSHEHANELRIETKSLTFGYICKIEKVYPDKSKTHEDYAKAFLKAESNAISFIYQEAKKRLLTGKIIPEKKNLKVYPIMA